MASIVWYSKTFTEGVTHAIGILLSIPPLSPGVLNIYLLASCAMDKWGLSTVCVF